MEPSEPGLTEVSQLSDSKFQNSGFEDIITFLAPGGLAIIWRWNTKLFSRHNPEAILQKG